MKFVSKFALALSVAGLSLMPTQVMHRKSPKRKKRARKPLRLLRPSVTIPSRLSRPTVRLRTC